MKIFSMLLLFGVSISILDKGTTEPERRLDDDKPFNEIEEAKNDVLEKGDMNAMKELFRSQEALQNFKKLYGWLADVQIKLNDLRENFSSKIGDMAIGLQRRNMIMNNSHYMGASLGIGFNSLGNMNPYAHS